MDEVKKIVSFSNLEVYQNTYEAMLLTARHILPKLPDHEKYDLRDQISRASKSIPRLIAEGYAKRHQRAGFQKYLDDAMGESNELVVSLSQCKDLYPQQINAVTCKDLIDRYDKVGRQLYRLNIAWHKFKNSNIIRSR